MIMMIKCMLMLAVTIIIVYKSRIKCIARVHHVGWIVSLSEILLHASCLFLILCMFVLIDKYLLCY